MNKTKKYRAGIIGCGKIGVEEGNYSKDVKPGTHAGAFSASKKIDLVACADLDEKRLKVAKSYFPNVNLYNDPERMLREKKLDIVSVATPTKYHYQGVMLATKHKCKAILCEKPIAYNIEQAKKMIFECKKRKCKLFVNHQRHFDPVLKKWEKKINNDLLGDLLQGNAFYYNGFFNNGTHLIDLIVSFFGKPKSVRGLYNRKTSISKDDLNIDGMIFFKNGLVVSLHSLSRNYGHFGLRIFGEKGMLTVSNLGFTVKYRKKIKNRNYKGFFELEKKSIKEGRPRSMIISTVENVISSLEMKNQVVDPGRDGLIVLKVLLALEKSAKNNGKKVIIT